MAGTGPNPNPNAKRTNARIGPVLLPAEGRRGRTPKWPLPDNPRLIAKLESEQALIDDLEDQELEDVGLTRAKSAQLTRARQRLAVVEVEIRVVHETETEIWRDLWHTPQACQWEKLGWTREVAQYVRWKALAECGDLDAGKEARQLGDRLGLTPKAMRALMWSVAADEVGARRAERQPTRKGRPERHLAAVDGEG